jgi:hypothetical protein
MAIPPLHRYYHYYSTRARVAQPFFFEMAIPPFLIVQNAIRERVDTNLFDIFSKSEKNEKNFKKVLDKRGKG